MEVMNIMIKHINKPEDVWKHMDIKGKDECWEWTGSTIKNYGRMRVNGKQYYTHRIVYELINGSIPKNIQVCHRCDNSRCNNLSHLFAGTMQDNMGDKISKHRQYFPMRNTLSWMKITTEQCDDIKNLYNTGNYTQLELSVMYKVHQTTIGRIINPIYEVRK
jgi:hypothetical protein